MIAEVANACFYESALRHGCTPAQRPPLLPGLPPLLWLDVMGQEQGAPGHSGGGSLCNPQEAATIARLLGVAVQDAGIAADRCGVIACYKRQVACVQQALGASTCGAVQVATVDSFQVDFVTWPHVAVSPRSPGPGA